jgi:PTS system N-acetylglucosamine-specific IIC component
MRFDLKTPGRDLHEQLAAAPAAAPAERAREWIAALGGAVNLKSLNACTTRLRLTIANPSAVDVDALKRLGARGVVRPAPGALQVVVGTIADQLAGEIRGALQSSAARPPRGTWSGDAAGLLAALGGRTNVRTVDVAASRLRVSVGDAALIDRTAMGMLGVRGVAVPVAGCVHVIVGPAAEAVGAALRRLLGPAARSTGSLPHLSRDGT